ncbi:MAG: 7TM diverse intracellular signaling domain-containing protein [Niabella sp.]
MMPKKLLTKALFSILILLVYLKPYAQTTVVTEQSSKPVFVTKGISLYKDEKCNLPYSQVVQKTFTRYGDGMVSLGFRKSAIWLRFSIENKSDVEQLYLRVANPQIDSICLFYFQDSNRYLSAHMGEYKNFGNRFFQVPNYIIPVNIPKGQTREFFIRVKSIDQLSLPISVGPLAQIMAQENESAINFSIYLGIVLIMVLYNTFLYISVKDSSYLYYILFIIFVGLSQFMLRGYTFQLFWPNHPTFTKVSSFIIPFLSGITTALFMKHFLYTKQNAPKLDWGINAFMILYLISLITGLFINPHAGMQLQQLAASTGSLFSLVLGFVLVRKGYRPAVFFLIAYSVFLLSIILFVLTNFNILPYNTFSSNALEIGSAIQITLLSLALADKINAYRADALKAYQENEKLIMEQNVVLEQKVKQRTKELTVANSDLRNAMETLKSTQSQLVNAEKMSSLGQLTAGIAHEINNPINFVTSNVRPLKMDFDDIQQVIGKYEKLDTSGNVEEQLAEIERFKKQIDLGYVQEEISSLLSGISEGAQRTAEIVRGLKNFARVDEDNMKYSDINHGIDSTLLLIRNTFPKNMQLVKDLGELPEVECMPGKINQVFMNIIANAVHAIKKMHKNEYDGQLSIRSWYEEPFVHISIKDNGTGMPESVKQKIFDPFFTTKDVGEGTGLGMSIVQGILERHNGQIQIFSEEGKGTEFIISLPVHQSKPSAPNLNQT